MLPFDKRYKIDAMFKRNYPMASVFPKNVGNGVLMLEGILGNLAVQCWLVDDYCIQFSEDRCMHVYDMHNKIYKKYPMENLDQSDFEWIAGNLNYANSFYEPFMELKNNARSNMEQTLVKSYIYLFSVIEFTNKNNLTIQEKTQLKSIVEELNYTFDTEFINNNFYKNGKRLNLGSLGRDIINHIANVI